MIRSHLFRSLTLAVSLVTSLVLVPAEAEAGCLIQYGECAQCAQDTLWDGMKSLSPSKILRANLELADCSIDLYHCVAYGKGHEYPCAL